MKALPFAVITAAMLVASTTAQADHAMELAKKSGCLGCHAIDRTIVGPAWKAVAKKYRADPKAEQVLMTSIYQGSQGKWGNKVHMKAQKNIPEADVRELVQFILQLK